MIIMQQESQLDYYVWHSSYLIYLTSNFLQKKLYARKSIFKQVYINILV